MCTLSWWISESERGIVFNRDERRTRSRGEAPRIVEMENGTRILMPRDPDAGGTWLGVNDSGLIIALLNNYPFHIPPRTNQISRGQLVVDLLRRTRSAEQCMDELNSRDCSIYQGFLLFALGHNDGQLALKWDGLDLKPIQLGGEKGLHVLTSSSMRREECEAFRIELFANLNRERLCLKEKHTVFNAADPALGPLMLRDDAATDSVTEVIVGPKSSRMYFHPVKGNPPKLCQSSMHDLAWQEPDRE